MSVTVGSVWRPAHGTGGKVVVRAVNGTQALVEPWPRKARQNLRRTAVNLASDRDGLAGYTATGETG